MVGHSDKGLLMPLANNFSGGKDYYYTETFKTMVRSERELLLRVTREVPIRSLSELQAYRNDFYRLLRAYNVSEHLHWVTAYLNGIEDPFADCGNMKSIHLIDDSILSERIARSNTTQA